MMGREVVVKARGIERLAVQEALDPLRPPPPGALRRSLALFRIGT